MIIIIITANGKRKGKENYYILRGALTITNNFMAGLTLDMTRNPKVIVLALLQISCAEQMNLRCKAYTTSIFLIFGIIETLPLGQSLSPAIAFLWLELGVFLSVLLFDYICAIDFLQVKTHSSAGNRQKMGDMKLKGFGCFLLGLSPRFLDEAGRRVVKGKKKSRREQSICRKMSSRLLRGVSNAGIWGMTVGTMG